MRYILLLIVVVIMTTSTGCVNRSGGPLGASIDTTTKSEELTEQVLSEEQPPIQKAQVNIGTLKQHQDGYSIGSETEWTKLKKLLSDKKNDVIEISWVWDCGPKYGNMPMKLIYDRNSGTLSRIFTQTNVKEVYSGVSPESLQAFLANKENDIYAIERYSKDAKYDFNNREMRNAKAGAKPEQESNGTVKIVADFIKDNIQNAKILGWSKVVAYNDYWAVRCEYKFNDNITGESITNNVWFYIQNNQVVAIKDVLGNIVNL